MTQPAYKYGAFRERSVSTKTKLYKMIGRKSDLVLNGRVLILDPSCGSMSSRPGYCIREAGVVVDSGTIEMPVEAKLHRRLYYLARTLREQFPEVFDVVVVEDVPALRFNKFGRSLASQIPLHYSVGVCMSAFDCRLFLTVSPSTWRAYAAEEHLEEKEMGVGSDEADALAMGHAVHMHAAHAKMHVGKPKKKRGSKRKGGDA